MGRTRARHSDSKSVPAYPEHAAWVEEIRNICEVIRLTDKYFDSPNLIGAQPPIIATGVRELRAVTLARSGAPLRPPRRLARSSRSQTSQMRSSSSLRTPTPAAGSLDKSQSATRSQYQAAAIALLRQVIATGKLQAAIFPFDPDFAGLPTTQISLR